MDNNFIPSYIRDVTHFVNIQKDLSAFLDNTLLVNMDNQR